MEVCKIIQVDEDKLKKVKQHITNQDTISFMADVFRAMAEPLRLSILMLLSETELCVCEIMELLNQKQSTVSHHLRILRDLRIVKNRKDGKNVFYSLQDSHIKDILKINKEHILEEK